MSIETNKRMIKELFEGINHGQLEVMEGHPGFWETRQYMPLNHQCFADWRTVKLQQIAEGDKVFSYAANQMTHIGSIAGLPATGKRVTLELFSIEQIVDGVVVEHNATATWPDLFRQLGLPGFAAWPVRTPRTLHQQSPALPISAEINRQAVLRLPQKLTQGRVSPVALENGLGELQNDFTAIQAAFPDVEATVVCQIAEGELVATRITLSGTHRGWLFGLAPTGRRLMWDQFMLNRVVDGMVVEHIGAVDWTAVLIHLGQFPMFNAEMMQPA
jgi:predicted ester cyclase